MNELLASVIPLLSSAIRLSVPLLLAALAGLFAERSGVFDIGLEGKMLVGAFASASVSAVVISNTGLGAAAPWMGLLAGMGVGIVFAMIHGYASITQRGNQIVSGVAINFLAAGLTVLVGQSLFRQGGRTPLLPGAGRFGPLTLPGADWARDNIPILGPLYRGVISGHNAIAYIAFLLVPVSWWVLYRTRFGLRLRAVGENPAAVDTAGISVAWLRYRALIWTGALCGMAGAYLSIAQSAQFDRDMSAGRGFIALAALIFAKWRPWPVMWTCLLFGILDVAAINLQGVQIPGIGVVPVQAIQALPYVLTVILLAGFMGKAVPPKAGGVPYVKER